MKTIFIEPECDLLGNTLAGEHWDDLDLIIQRGKFDPYVYRE